MISLLICCSIVIVQIYCWLWLELNYLWNLSKHQHSQGEDPWNVSSICRNASSMWTNSLQMQWNTTDICKNGGKFPQMWLCIFLYVDSELRIPEAFFCPFDQNFENADNDILSKNPIWCRDLGHIQHGWRRDYLIIENY